MRQPWPLCPAVPLSQHPATHLAAAVCRQQRLGERVLYALPLSLMALGLSFAYERRIWNIGAE